MDPKYKILTYCTKLAEALGHLINNATLGQLSDKADVYSFGVLLSKNLDYNMPADIEVYL
jgi:hypothetical protein